VGDEGVSVSGGGKWQGLTLLHLSAQRERFLWDRGCIWVLCRGSLGGVRGYEGILGVFCVRNGSR